MAFCTECGKRLEDHEYGNRQMEDSPLQEFGISFDHRNLDIIEYTAPCDTCGKNLFDHPVRCRYCGRVFCRQHAKPENHACTNIPPPPPPPPQPVLSTGEKVAFGLEVAVQVVIILIGIAIVIWGFGIAADNRSGRHVTFPFAGYITSTIGFLIIAAGVQLRALRRALGI